MGEHMNKIPTYIKAKRLYDELLERRNFQCPEYETCLNATASHDLDLIVSIAH